MNLKNGKQNDSTVLSLSVKNCNAIPDIAESQRKVGMHVQNNWKKLLVLLTCLILSASLAASPAFATGDEETPDDAPAAVQGTDQTRGVSSGEETTANMPAVGQDAGQSGGESFNQDTLSGDSAADQGVDTMDESVAGALDSAAQSVLDTAQATLGSTLLGSPSVSGDEPSGSTILGNAPSGGETASTIQDAINEALLKIQNGSSTDYEIVIDVDDLSAESYSQGVKIEKTFTVGDTAYTLTDEQLEQLSVKLTSTEGAEMSGDWMINGIKVVLENLEFSGTVDIRDAKGRSYVLTAPGMFSATVNPDGTFLTTKVSVTLDEETVVINNTVAELTVTGSDDDDVFSVASNSGTLTINAGGGDDTIIAQVDGGSLTVDAGNGTDTVSVSGGSGNDTIVVKAGGEDIVNVNAGAGDDTVTLTGAGAVYGGDGSDTISYDVGGTGVATLDGGSGEDTLRLTGSLGKTTGNSYSAEKGIYSLKGGSVVLTVRDMDNVVDDVTDKPVVSIAGHLTATTYNNAGEPITSGEGNYKKYTYTISESFTVYYYDVDGDEVYASSSSIKAANSVDQLTFLNPDGVQFTTVLIAADDDLTVRQLDASGVPVLMLKADNVTVNGEVRVQDVAIIGKTLTLGLTDNSVGTIIASGDVGIAAFDDDTTFKSTLTMESIGLGGVLDIANTVAGAAESVNGFAGDLVDYVQDAINAVEGLKKTYKEKVKDPVNGLFADADNALDSAKDAVDSVQSTIVSARDSVLETTQTIISEVTGTLRAAVEQMYSTVNTAIGTARSAVNTAKDSLDLIDSGIDSAAQTATGAVSSAASAATGKLDDLSNAITTAKTAATDALANGAALANDAANGAKDGISTAKGLADSAIGTVNSSLTGADSYLTQAGTVITNAGGYVSNINDMLTDVTDVLGTASGTLTSIGTNMGSVSTSMSGALGSVTDYLNVDALDGVVNSLEEQLVDSGIIRTTANTIVSGIDSILSAALEKLESVKGAGAAVQLIKSEAGDFSVDEGIALSLDQVRLYLLQEEDSTEIPEGFAYSATTEAALEALLGAGKDYLLKNKEALLEAAQSAMSDATDAVSGTGDAAKAAGDVVSNAKTAISPP